MNKRLPLILMGLLFLFSCSQGKETTSTTMMVLGATGSGVSSLNGGIIIYGHNDEGDHFSLSYSQNEVELPNGNWNFYTSTWDGGTTGSSFEGTMRCAVQRGINLSGGEIEIDFTLTTAACADSFFGPSDTKETDGQLKGFVPYACTEGDDLNGFDLSSCKNSIGLSYQVQLHGVQNGTDTGPLLTSRCIDDSTPSTPDIVDSSPDALRLPVFLPAPIAQKYSLILYEESGCTGIPQYIETESFVTNTSSPFRYELNTQGSDNSLLVHNPVCGGRFATDATPFVSGSGPADVYICNMAQLSAASVTATDNIIFGQDVDFAGSVLTGPVINYDYTGTIDGKGHRLMNWTYDAGTGTYRGAFVKRLYPGGVIKNLKFENVTLNTTAIGGSGGSGNGIVTGQMNDNSTVKNIELVGITINAANNRHKIGAIVGVTTNGTPGTAPEIMNIKGDGITINLAGAEAEDIGSLVGSTDEMRLENVLLNNVNILSNATVTTGETAENIGGVVGSTSGLRGLSEIHNVQVENLNLGTVTNPFAKSAGTLTRIGGVIGEGRKLSAINVKVAGNIVVNNGFEVGGFAGVLRAKAETNVFANILANTGVTTSGVGEITSERVGGIVGRIYQIDTGSSFDFINVRSLTNLECDNQCGLFAGISAADNKPLNVNFFIGQGSITSRTTAQNTGGLNGIANSTLTADNIHLDVVMSKENTSGTQENLSGLIGEISGNTGAVTVTNAYVAGSMAGFSSNTNTGGVIGNLDKSGGSCFVGNTVTVFNQQGGSQKCVGTISAGSLTPSNVYGLDASDAPSNCATKTAAQLSGGGVVSGLALNTSYWQDTAATYPQLKIYDTYSLLGLASAGSRFDPFWLSSPAQWNAIGDNPFLMSSTFKLLNDLDFDGVSFTPVGSMTYPFSGQLMGNNMVIRNIDFTETTSSQGPIGLIRYATDAYISDFDEFTHESRSLTLENITMDTGSELLGGGLLVGFINDSAQGSSEIENVTIINSSISGGGSSANTYIGGAIGYASLNAGESTIDNVTLVSTDVNAVAGSSGVGGVIGSFISTYSGSDAENIRRLTYSGDVTSAIDYSGGIFGKFESEDKSARILIVKEGTTVSGEDYVGGVVGYQPKGTIAQAVSKANVMASMSGAGGISGFLGAVSQNAKIVSSYAEGAVTASSGTAGCLSGSTLSGSSASISNSYGNCTQVTGNTVSYFAIDHGFMNSPTVKSAYTAPSAEGGINSAKAGFVSDSELRDESHLATNSLLTLGDPWILADGNVPRPWFELFPQFLD